MSSQQRTVAFLLEQMAGAGAVSARRMFGEYAIYLDGKVVALVCDDRLFVKPTAAGRALLGADWPEASAYDGATPSLLIPADRWDDRDWLATLVRTTADALPAPKPKSPARRATAATATAAKTVKTVKKASVPKAPRRSR